MPEEYVNCLPTGARDFVSAFSELLLKAILSVVNVIMPIRMEQSDTKYTIIVKFYMLNFNWIVF
jgi:hypothetical protein